MNLYRVLGVHPDEDDAEVLLAALEAKREQWTNGARTRKQKRDANKFLPMVEAFRAAIVDPAQRAQHRKDAGQDYVGRPQAPLESAGPGLDADALERIKRMVAAGLGALERGDVVNALGAAERAQEIWPESPDARDLHQRALATQAAQDAVLLDARDALDDRRAQRALELVQGLPNSPSRSQLLSQVEGQVRDADALVRRAGDQVTQGDVDGAVGTLNQALALVVDHTRATAALRQLVPPPPETEPEGPEDPEGPEEPAREPESSGLTPEPDKNPSESTPVASEIDHPAPETEPAAPEAQLDLPEPELPQAERHQAEPERDPAEPERHQPEPEPVCCDPVSRLRARARGQDVLLTWTWPAGLPRVRLGYSHTAPVDGPEQDHAMYESVTRVRYTSEDSYTLVVDEKRAVFISVFSPTETGWSEPTQTTAAVGGGVRVHYALARVGLFRKRWVLRMRAEAPVALQGLVLVVRRRDVPKGLDDGTVIERIERIELGAGHTDHPLPTGAGPGFVGVFFGDPSRVAGVRLMAADAEQRKLS